MLKHEEILFKVKKKKELSGLSDSVVYDSLDSYLKRNHLSLSGLGMREEKEIIKQVRAQLRKYTGRFQYSLEERTKLLRSGKYTELLKTHSSTFERQAEYPFFKEKISSLKVQSILDLGCGLNPIALADKNLTYYASDIREDEIKILDEFFKRESIKGRAFIYNINKIDSSLPSVDLCLLLKVLDLIENKGHKLAEKILRTVRAKYFFISFSTKTLSGKPMNHPQRGWIERLMTRIGFQWEMVNLKNEVLYIANSS